MAKSVEFILKCGYIGTVNEFMNESDASFARVKYISECVLALRRALITAPIGWGIAVWFCWRNVPLSSILLWLETAVILWVASLVVLRKVILNRSTPELYRNCIHGAAGLDGFAWGLIPWFLMGHDSILDAMLLALQFGVISINSQVYGAYVAAYYWQIGSFWVVSALGLWHAVNSPIAIDYAIGLSIFIVLIAYHTRATSGRLLEGIRLQHANLLLTAELRATLQRVELDAATDPLTGHWNRRALDDILRHQAERRSTCFRPLSILMLDVDHFKKINDEFGHMVGDDVLRAFAQRLREFLRAGDFCARFGGEEFIVVLPETRLATALEIAERIRNGMARCPLLRRPRIQVTVSIGVATMKQGQSISDLLVEADAAVYVAKHAGRNQVRVNKYSR